MRRRILHAAVSACLLAGLAAPAAHGATATLDPSFAGGAGYTLTSFNVPSSPFDFSDVQAESVAIDGSQRIVAVGSAFGSAGGSPGHFALARYGGNGSLDDGFGLGGRSIDHYGPSFSRNSRAVGIGRQSDGRYIVAGVDEGPSPNPNSTVLVARYETNAQLDNNSTTGFGAAHDGFFSQHFGDANAALDVRALKVLSNDKIVVAGWAVVGGKRKFLVARLDADGTLDTTFSNGDGDGVDGAALTSVGDPAKDAEAQGLVVLPGGDVVATGHSDGTAPASYTHFALVRYNGDGSGSIGDGQLDTGFDGDGIVTSTFGAGALFATDATLETPPGGALSIVVSGWSDGGGFMALARYRADTGALDTSFDGDGIVTTQFPGYSQATARAVTVSDGKLLVTGHVVNGSTGRLAMVQYGADGALDQGFGNGGAALLDFGDGGNTRGRGIALQSDGKPVVAGFAMDGGHRKIVVARFLAVQPPAEPVSWREQPTPEGDARPGGTLTLKPQWTGSRPIELTYEWERCSYGNFCQAIPGTKRTVTSQFAGSPEEQTSYTLTDFDADYDFRVHVVAVNAKGRGEFYSKGSAHAPIALQPPTIYAGDNPGFSGLARVGQTLQGLHGSWTGLPSTFDYYYAWQRCTGPASDPDCQTVYDKSDTYTGTRGEGAGAHSRYEVTSEDVGYRIRLVVLAVNDAGFGFGASSLSDEVTPVCQGVLRFGPLEARGCLKRDGLVWTSTASVDLNGIHLTPAGGKAKIVIDPLNLRVAGNAKVTVGPTTVLGRRLGPYTLYDGSFEWVFQGAVSSFLNDQVMRRLRGSNGGGAPEDSDRARPPHIVDLPDLPGLAKLDVGLPDFSKVRSLTDLEREPGVGNLSIPSLNADTVELPARLIPRFDLPPMCLDTASRAELASLPISGKACVKLGADQAILTAHVALPRSLGGVTADAMVVIQRNGQIRLGDSRAGVGDISFGPLTLNNTFVAYTAADDRWHGEAHAGLLDLTADGSFDVVEGRLRNGAVTLGSGNGVPLGATGLFVDKLGLRYDTFPDQVIGGTGGIGFGPKVNQSRIVRVDVDPSYNFTQKIFNLDGTLYFLGNRELHAFVTWYVDGAKVAFGTDLRHDWEWDAGWFGHHKAGLAATVDGFVSSRGFQVDGYGAAYLDNALINAQTTVGTRGVAACASLQGPKGSLPIIPGFVTLSWDFNGKAGVGYKWNEPHDFKSFGGGACGMADYQLVPRNPGDPLARSAAVGGQTLELPAGLRQTSLAIKGTTGAPRVTLVRPDGRQIVTPAGPEPVSEPDHLVLYDEPNRITYVLLSDPAGGRWGVVPQEGSSPIEEIRKADALPEVKITARVDGHGRRRSLRYRVNRIPGQRVTFREESGSVAEVIGSATGSAGTIRFTPADARGGTRRIVASIEQDGLPREERTVARYVAPPPMRPRAPRRASVRRSGSRAVIRWTPSPGARRYAVSVVSNAGERRLHLLPSRTRVLRLRGLVTSEPLRVSVRGVSAAGRRGAVRRASAERLRATKRARTPKRSRKRAG